MSKMIFVNLPVKDLAAATRFYKAIGCEKNEQFSNQQSACMVWSDTITFQLLTREQFAAFAPKPVGDAHKSSAMLIALSCENRAAVDRLANAAADAGGKVDVKAPQDYGYMFVRTFEDPDGHTFEPIWLDMTALPKA